MTTNRTPATRRIALAEHLFPGILRLLTCDLCDDDLAIHEWIEVETPMTPTNIKIVNCDRN